MNIVTPANRPDTLAALATLGEWAAMGFYEALDEPWPRAYGRAFRRLYERMDIVLMPGHRLVPCEPLPRARTMQSHQTWTAASLICDFEHNAGLRLNFNIAEERKAQFPAQAAFIDQLCADLKGRLPGFGGYTHSNPDIRRVVGEGFLAMVQELDQELQLVEQERQAAPSPELDAAWNLLLALKDYTTGVAAFHRRIGEALAQAIATEADARCRDTLATTAAAWRKAFLHPAGSFLEGLLAVHFCWMLDGHDSIGRFDQALGPLFDKDLAEGRLTLSDARELLDEVWQYFEHLNGWNLQLGGRTPAGHDGCNRLTLECLDACQRNKFRRPNVAFRITADTPDTALEHALRVLANGSGRPALYNDDLYIRTLRELDLGLTEADAREVGFGGCTETMIPGMSNVGSLDGEINLAWCLSLALRDGYDAMQHRQVGPHTGPLASFTTFEELLAAVRRQIQYATDLHVIWLKDALRRRFTEGDPKLYRTFFTRDCVRNRKSFEGGGARYNWSVVSYHGIANLIDSLYTVQQLVYAGKSITADELTAVLDADFAGPRGAALRQQIAALPKFGNNRPEVDALGREIIGFAWRELLAHETPRGGRFLPSCILFTTYYLAGLAVPATPDGRKAGEVLADSVGPAQGRDLLGPTALFNSVVHLPLTLAAGTPVLNLRLGKRLFATDEGVHKVATLVRTFFAGGGMQLQLSVLDQAELLAAQQEPEKYANLIVRIGGYSEYFTRLNRATQDSVIARVEH